MNIEAQTTKNVKGRLKPVDWQTNSQKWPHLQGFYFRSLDKKCKIDLLIGLDYVELHRSLCEIHGNQGEPVARLTPLGWTCVGPYAKARQSDCFNNFFVAEASERTELNGKLKRFWEIKEGCQRSKRDNAESAKKRLGNTEKRLLRDPDLYHKYGEIHSKTNPEQWRHVPTKSNLADMGSRGVTIDKLGEDDMWWTGPKFLRECPENWPKNDFKPDETARSDQKCKSANNSNERVFLSHTESKGDLNRLDPERFSSWSRLVRVYAWVERFIDNCQLPNVERQDGKSLTAIEISSAEPMIICEPQNRNFNAEIKSLKQGKQLPKTSKILNLNPKLDEDGLMRGDSRLKYVDFVSYYVRYPVIMPRKDWVTKLIVRDFHENCKHGETNQTLAALSTQYWALAAREVIRETENECRVCRSRKARAAKQIMGPITELRIGQSMHDFSQTAVDYAGPFFTKQGRGRPTKKRCLCLFTCMACRAVHLELSYSLETDSFLNAFYRFVNRRGIPKILLSDNGTNFVGTVRELKELVKALDHDKIVNSVANTGIKWRFTPPFAPYFGRVHEAMVKSAKKAIYTILGNADINNEELLTAFSGAKGLIKSRPLTYQSANPEDEPVPTPSHFLHGQSGGSVCSRQRRHDDLQRQKEMETCTRTSEAFLGQMVLRVHA